MITVEYIATHINEFTQYSETKVSLYEKMKVHTRGVGGGDTIIKRHPTEDEATFKWRKDNLVYITKPIINKAINSINRIFQDANIFWTAGSDATNEYISNKLFYGLDLLLFVQQVVVRSMIEDANAYLVVYPTDRVLDDKKIDIAIDIIHSDCQVYTDTDFILFTTNKQKHLTRVHYLSKVEYALLERSKISDNFTIKYRYQHDLNTLTYTVLGGNIIEPDLYSSFFDSFCEFGDEALRQFSDWQSIMANCAYPIKEVRPIQCNAEGCSGGYIEGKKCGKCNGSGYISFTSPMSVVVRPEANEALGKPDNDFPVIRYHSPDVSIIDYQQKAWELLLQKAIDSVNMSFVLEAQSGIAKAIDREELYSMLNRISNNVYDNVMYNTLWYIELYREIQLPQLPVIRKPFSFHIKTESDLVNELDALSKFPFKHIQLETYKELIDKRFSTDIYSQKIAHFLMKYDRLMGYNEDELTILLENEVITRKDWQKHEFSYSLLNEIIEQKNNEAKEIELRTGRKVQDWFLNSSFEEIANELDLMLNKII